MLLYTRTVIKVFKCNGRESNARRKSLFFELASMYSFCSFSFFGLTVSSESRIFPNDSEAKSIADVAEDDDDDDDGAGSSAGAGAGAGGGEEEEE